MLDMFDPTTAPVTDIALGCRADVRGHVGSLVRFTRGDGTVIIGWLTEHDIARGADGLCKPIWPNRPDTIPVVCDVHGQPVVDQAIREAALDLIAARREVDRYRGTGDADEWLRSPAADAHIAAVFALRTAIMTAPLTMLLPTR